MIDANTKKELELAAGWEPPAGGCGACGGPIEAVGYRPDCGTYGATLSPAAPASGLAATRKVVRALESQVRNAEIARGHSLDYDPIMFAVNDLKITEGDVNAAVLELSVRPPAPAVADLVVTAPAADEALAGAAEAFRAEGGLVGDLTANVLDWVGIALKAGDQDRIDRLTAAMLALIGDKP